MTPPKDPSSKDKPYRTRTYRRTEGGSSTEGFDAPRSEGAPPRRATGDAAPWRKSYGDEGPKRRTYGDDGPRRKSFGDDGPGRKPYGDGAPKRKPYGEGAPKRTYERRTRPFSDDRPGRPMRSEEGSWRKVAPATGEQASEGAALQTTVARIVSEGFEPLTVSLPGKLRQRLQERAAELGLQPEALAQVWLADKLR